MEDARETSPLARATALLTAAARTQRDRKLQQALIELAGLVDAHERSPAPTAADVDRLNAKARALAQTASIVGAEEAAAAARFVQTVLAEPGAGAAPPAVGTAPRPATTGHLGTGTMPVREAPLILVVEDDPDVLRLLMLRLKGAGYRVEAAEDGEDGFAKAKISRPALIVCDLGMPLVPGEMLILALRIDPDTASIPIAVVTGDPTRLGPEHQVDAVLVKPVQVADLLATVHRLVSLPARSRG
jgi:CheY-like chemotaxis protein